MRGNDSLSPRTLRVSLALRRTWGAAGARASGRQGHGPDVGGGQ